MTNHRVLVDLEFDVDEDRFKIDQLTDNATGVSDVTDPGLRDAISRILIRADWAEHGLTPVRSVVTSRP
ncbi:hypothetical protein N1028_13435 [Herbiconiux sp. CPCC 203407]|uniref:Uncharacterized protein n=1 Tax=Herbiconiux oxytropis TaxID=2970915 RepID=A0AA41XET5_9MICO|nr:hypothetical protein [Herbiconiux oxytropis]MCS5723034.1 hypothetical protein [Herbiconiux oxytropis]MCS5726897.1 hypothetical protein [Herbiconiux oxytropis]